MSQFESVDVQRLRWFVAVAEELHFARAAKSLHISRQKLSHTIIDLEGELGTKLFVPGAQPTQLTDAGHDLLPAARELVARDDERLAARRRAEQAAAESLPTLRVGFVPGVTVTKWTRIWAERFPQLQLEVVALRADEQAAALRERRVDMAFVRLPIDRESMSAIPLYREVPVVLVPKDHPIAAFDEVGLADLADEQRPDTVDLDEAAPALELVAAGVGIVIVPHSIARLHARRDLVYRPVTDAADTEIVLMWPTAQTTDLVEEFVGIVRGRSQQSSRTPVALRAEPSRKTPAKKSASKPTGKGRPTAARKSAKRRGR